MLGGRECLGFFPHPELQLWILKEKSQLYLESWFNQSLYCCELMSLFLCNQLSFLACQEQKPQLAEEQP